MRTEYKLYFSSLLILVIFMAACPSVNKSYPERTYFMFELSQPEQTATTVEGTTVEIKRFNISPASQGKEFIYRTTDINFRSDFYNQFFRAPNTIMTEAVARWINQAGIFQNVLSPLSQVFPNYLIEGNIIEIYGDYRSLSAPKAMIRVQFYLLKTSDDTDEPLIIFGKTYESDQPIDSATPQALMNGWNLALENILGEFLKDLSYYLPKAQQQ